MIVALPRPLMPQGVEHTYEHHNAEMNRETASTSEAARS